MRQAPNHRWIQKIRTLYQQRWMPILLGIIATIAVLGVWQQLSLQENRQIEQIVAEKAALTETLLARELVDRVQALQRIVDRWQVSGGPSQFLWEADAATYIRDLPGFQAIEWVDPSFRVRWVVPVTGNEAAQNLDLSHEFHRHNTLRISRELRQPFLSGMVSLVQGGNGFLASVPIFLGEQFDGFILGVFWNPAFFDSVLLVPEGFHICVYDHGRLMYSSGGVQQTPFKKTVAIEAYAVNWQVDVFPTPVFVARQRTLLPRVVLFGGLMGGWTLALTGYLGQRSAHYAHQARKTNQQLQAEIVERERVEATLRESEERLYLALEAAHEGWWDWNLLTNKVERSLQYLHLLGYEVGEFPETFESWETAVHPDDFPELRNRLLAHLQNSSVPYACEYRLRTRSGDWLWIADYGKVVNRDEHNQPLRMIGTFKDISERKATEAALRHSEASLRQSEEKFRQLAENIRAVFWMSDPAADRVLYVSPAFEAIWGYSCEALYQDFSLWIESIHPDDRARIEQAQVADVFQGTYDEEYRIIRPDGSIRWIHDRGFPVKIPNADSKRIAGIAEDITNRKQTEIALAKELLRSQTFFNTSIDGVVVMNYQGDVIQTSPSFARMLGYSVEETLTLNVADWEAQWTPEELQSLLQTNKLPPLFETKHRRKDGSLYDAEISYSHVELEGERFHFCMCRDISDRKRIEVERQQAEQALRQSEATKQAIIQAIPDLLIRMRADGSYVEFISNSKFNLINPDQQRHHTNLRNILPPELVEQRLEYTRRSLESGRTQIYEHEILIQGKQCYEEVRIVPLMSDEVLVMVRDITDHKQAETALQLSEERLQLALEASGDGLWDWNLETGEIYLSPRYQEMLGYAPNESVITSEEWKQIIHPEDRAWVLKCLDEYLQDSLVRYSFDYRIRCKSGAWKWIADYGKVVARDHQGKPLRMIGTYKDISDRKQKELALQQAMEAAEAANLAKSIFLANMSHELRTPLNVILGFTQVMAHDTSLTSNQREDLHTIRRSGDHLLSLINDVLDLSKIEAGHCTLEETGFDLISLLHTIRTMMAERAASKHLQFTVEIAPEVPQFVVADEQKLRQILLNLLSNAIKFTSQGSVTLRVCVEEGERKGGKEQEKVDLQKHRVNGAEENKNEAGENKMSHLFTPPTSAISLEFKVIDTGVGIAAQEQETIFDAFVQAEAGKKSVSGTGLGLTISRKLLELMQGEISVQSVLNVGSTFTFTVPVHSTSSITLQPEQHDRLVIGLAPGQPHHRILVVDDQTENRLLLIRLLTQLGLEVREATNGQDAIRLWQEWQPDLIWMDIRMPGLDGYETTRQIRSMEQKKASVIIALTAQASQSDRALALAAGCNDYISKPFQEETLFLKLKEYLGLEYLYADSDPFASCSIAPVSSSDAEIVPPFDLAMLAELPAEWRAAVEDAALCGNDWTIIDLVTQLPPEFAALGAQLTNMAYQFQFEQILALIRHHSAS